jgi:DNA-binding NarL/FixJ family response regulator
MRGTGGRDRLISERDKTRVVLCDDHDLFRSGRAEMLATAEVIEVVGEANAHERVLAVVSEAGPDVVLPARGGGEGPAERATLERLAT